MNRFTLPALMLCLAASAPAQVAEFGFYGGVQRLDGEVLGTIPPTTVSLTDGWRFGFRVTLNNWRFFGHEFGYGYNRTKLRFSDPSGTQEAGMAIHQGFYNFLVYAIPEGSPVRPFVTGGGHFSNYTPPGTSVTSGGGSTKFGINYGGGVKARVSERFGIRFDVRQYVTGKPFDLQGSSGSLKLLEISAGFSLLL